MLRGPYASRRTTRRHSNLRSSLQAWSFPSSSGSPTRRIDDAASIRRVLKTIPWGGRELYVTQYVPYRDPKGMHTKLRLVVVGEEIFLRHVISADDWHVHAQDRSADALQNEQAALAHFDARLLPAIRGRVVEISRRLRLDYFGIDCALTESGGLLLFEANAAMNNLLNTEPRPNCWERPIQRIRNALQDLLASPHRWYHHPARQPP